MGIIINHYKRSLINNQDFMESIRGFFLVAHLSCLGSNPSEEREIATQLLTFFPEGTMDSFPGTSLSLYIQLKVLSQIRSSQSVRCFIFCFGLHFLNHQVHTPENRQNKRGSLQKWCSGKGDELDLEIMRLRTNES